MQTGDRDKKREANNLSQNTMVGEQQQQQAVTMQPAEKLSQIEINGISIPENGSTLNKVSND